jgi:putative spermidine/putrescine transport system permease protein
MTGAFARGLAIAMMALASIFLLAPLVIIALSSLSPTPVFDLPVGGASLRWYAAVGSLEGLWPALLLSLEIALLTTAISLAIGTLAGIAIVRRAVPGADILAAAATSPLMMPGLVLGIALLQYFRSLGLTQAWPSLLLAHLVVTLPYVARTMIAGLSRFDFTLIDAARTLG